MVCVFKNLRVHPFRVREFDDIFAPPDDLDSAGLVTLNHVAHPKPSIFVTGSVRFGFVVEIAEEHALRFDTTLPSLQDLLPLVPIVQAHARA